ncbi:MAG: LysM peptidoglycan-binding domain-containing protein [Pontiellaceae bacterium]|nr:LysM peptidoglycan-binding domain-containing protein [Pontiellaceae bacterium]
MRKLCCLSIFIAAVVVCGCKKNEAEKTNPLIEKGEALYNEQKWDEAEKAFKEALAEGPELAKAHLGLARIYQENKVFLVHAIYHYDRFFELDPEAESKDLFVKEREDVKQMLIQSIISDPATVNEIRNQISNAVQANEAAWKREKAQLETQITRLKDQLQAARATPSTSTPSRATPSTSTPSRSTPTRTTPGTASAEPIIYTTTKSDTLSKIAGRFYGNSSKWTIIYEANKDEIPDPNRLRVGQSLIIPQLEE